jgi:hypothetical protein
MGNSQRPTDALVCSFRSFAADFDGVDAWLSRAMVFYTLQRFSND